MSEEEYFDIIDDISEEIQSDLSSTGTSEIIELRGADTEIAKTLVPQIGSDDDFIRKGKVDTRRFTNIEPEMVYWLSWFSMLDNEDGGGFTREWCEQIRNHRYSINGENKKLAINMTQAIVGASKSEKSDKKRSLIDKLLGRNKKTNEIYEVSD